MTQQSNTGDSADGDGIGALHCHECGGAVDIERRDDAIVTVRCGSCDGRGALADGRLWGILAPTGRVTG